MPNVYSHKKAPAKCRACYSGQTKDDLLTQYFFLIQIVAILPDTTSPKAKETVIFAESF
jgi:hypothetical protein